MQGEKTDDGGCNSLMIGWYVSFKSDTLPCRNEVLGRFEECKIKWHPRNMGQIFYEQEKINKFHNHVNIYKWYVADTFFSAVFNYKFLNGTKIICPTCCVYVFILGERSGALWPRTGRWGGEEGTWRRSRRDQSGDQQGPRTGYDWALESRHRWCARSPGTGKNE